MISGSADTSSGGRLQSTCSSKRPRSRSRSRSRSPPRIKSRESRRNPNPISRRGQRLLRHYPRDSGYTVDLEDLLFTRYRDFLIRNNGQKVPFYHLRRKTIVLITVPIDSERFIQPGECVDLLEAYHYLWPLGSIEFVLVPVYTPDNTNIDDMNYCRDRFHNLCSALPFPAVPFSDVNPCGDRVVHTFSVSLSWYWVIINPSRTVVATRSQYFNLFKLFCGAELYPLSLRMIRTLYFDFVLGDDRCLSYNYDDHRARRRESRKSLIWKWDQLLATPARDFLLSSNGNGDRVPISSLKGKLIGLYFCENIPCPPRMGAIKEAYRCAKCCGYDFEIVQINYHYEILNAQHTEAANFSERQHYENINWLTLPFKDPSCRKLQRILECRFEHDRFDWQGDCLVIVDTRRRRPHQVLFEFCGAEIIQQYGIQAYPFTRQSLIEIEYTRQRKEIKLQTLFPLGLCQFTRRRVGGHGFDLVNLSQLKGKRVLVLFSNFHQKDFSFISMLKSKYVEQAEEYKFEVVYVSTDECASDDVQDMPWLVHPFSHEFGKWCSGEIFKLDEAIEDGAVAFDIDGQIISKGLGGYLCGGIKDQFPFFSLDLRESIRMEVQFSCKLDTYYPET